MKRVLLFALLGAFVGFFVSYLVSAKPSGFNIGNLAFPLTIVLAAIAALAGAYYMSMINKIKNKGKKSLSGDEEDQFEAWSNKKFSDVTLASTVFQTLSLATGAIAIITNQPIELLVVGIILILVSIFSSTLINHAMKVVYKHRNLPSVTDKKFSDKLFKSADEGERHIMLTGLYSSFKMMNVLLPFAMIILMIYAEISGDSQVFSILIVAVIMITLNASYLFKIRSYY